MKTSEARDFAASRAAMVEWQLSQRGIHDPRVLEAFRQVPRHLFVPAELVQMAYDDCPLPIGEGQTISQPYMVAAMTEAAGLRGREKVLEVGTGSGYQAAILSRLAAHVFTIEQHAALSAAAQDRLRQLGVTNVTCLVGDGSLGYAAAAPYDAILVTAAAPTVPQTLLEQLVPGGRLLIPVGGRDSQELLLLQKKDGGVSRQTVNYCRFVPLGGRYGWGGE